MAKHRDGRLKERRKSATKWGTSKTTLSAQNGVTGTAANRSGNPSSEENHEVAALKGTKTITAGSEHDEPPPEIFGQRKRPENGQFRLQVDRQTKASYATREEAEEAGLSIKKAHPLLQVVVHDAVEGVHRPIEVSTAPLTELRS